MAVQAATERAPETPNSYDVAARDCTGAVSWAMRTNGSKCLRAAHSEAKQNLQHARVGKCLTKSAQVWQAGAAGPWHALHGTADGNATADAMDELSPTTAEAVRRAQLGCLLGDFGNIAATCRGALQKEVRALSRTMNTDENECSHCGEQRTHANRVAHVRHHCPGCATCDAE